MEDCKYSRACKFYGSIDCYSDHDDQDGCFRQRYFANNLHDRVIDVLPSQRVEQAEAMALDKLDLEGSL